MEIKKLIITIPFALGPAPAKKGASKPDGDAKGAAPNVAPLVRYIKGQAVTDTTEIQAILDRGPRNHYVKIAK